MNEKITSLIGLILVSAFLLGLAGSIAKPPFWVIVVLVLCGAWYGWYQEIIRGGGKER